VAYDFNETPNDEIIKWALPLIVDSSVDNIPKAIFDNPVGNCFVDPKALPHCWDEKYNEYNTD